MGWRGQNHEILIGKRLSVGITLTLGESVANGASIRRDGRIPDEAPHDANPRNGGKIIVVFGSHGLKLREARSRDAREVVVLVVISNIVGELIHDTIVGVSLMSRNPLVVFSNEVSSEGVERGTKHARKEEVEQSLAREEIPDEGINGELEDPLGDLPLGSRDGSREDRAEGVNERLEAKEDELTEGGAEELSLPTQRQVRIDGSLTLEAMMDQMVLLEGAAAGAKIQGKARDGVTCNKLDANAGDTSREVIHGKISARPVARFK